MLAIPTQEVFARLSLAVILGAVLGLEREYRRKPAGLRTIVLITLGSAMFSLVSVAVGTSAGSPDRIAAQIVTGVGFLGAGAILRSGFHIRGLTTAATIWVNAAVGTAAGVGLYAEATIGALIALVVLLVLPAVERRFGTAPDESHHRHG